MIAEVLDRRFVMQQMERVKKALAEEAKGGRRDAAPLPHQLEREDYSEALSALQTADTSGQPGFEPPAGAVSDRRDGAAAAAPPPLDERSFIGRDPALSNLQSAIEEFLITQAPEKVRTEAPRASDRRGGTAETADPVTGQRLAKPSDRRVGEQFSTTDVRWISSVFAMGVRRFRDRHPFKDQAASPVKIKDNARLILVGDWGSGVERAQKVSAQMRKVLDEGKAAGREQHVVHLGDVYYSGWNYEYERRFLKHWPVRADEAGAITSWTCNGNHDMYAGGHAYFKTALADPRFARHEGSSFFRLHNSRWQILGLDTGYEDHGLQGSQADWARSVLTAPENANSKGLLLSHHQIFSAHEGGADSALRTKIKPVLDTKRVHSWFWGHEHRCTLYGPRDNVQAARCVGHGGVPVYMKNTESDPLPAGVTYEYRARFKHGLEHWAYFGFAVLDFDGPAIEVRYIDELGREHHRERIAQ